MTNDFCYIYGFGVSIFINLYGLRSVLMLSTIAIRKASRKSEFVEKKSSILFHLFGRNKKKKQQFNSLLWDVVVLK